VGDEPRRDGTPAGPRGTGGESPSARHEAAAMSAVAGATRGEQPSWRFMLRHPAHILALGFGAGLSPVAPGTVGTLLALPLGNWMLARLPGWTYLAVCAALFTIGIRACAVAGRSLGSADHGAIVWDEIVAFLLVLFFVPASALAQAFAFLLFRLFDIAKVPPAGWIDRNLKTGFGVMADDLVAALYALVVLALAARATG
jgi:phosphatidylglycerophosphatase A